MLNLLMRFQLLFTRAGRKDAAELEAGFVKRLIHANANDRALGNGADIWYRDFHALIAAPVP